MARRIRRSPRLGPAVTLAGRWVPIFRLTAFGGAAAAVSLAIIEAQALGASPAFELVLCGLAIVTFLALVFVTKAIAGREVLVYYHHEIAVLTVTAFACAAIGPAHPGSYLDATALGLGACLALGRVGCTAAGCCYGRRCSRGIVYDERHAEEGFPRWLVGAPLFPVQAIESLLVATVVTIGAVAIADPHHPGAAFAFYVETYAVFRFFTEELRGDASRRFAFGLSEAQWTSLILLAILALLTAAGLLPGSAWSPAGIALVAPAAAVIVISRSWRSAGTRDLLDPHHVRELAGVVRRQVAALGQAQAPVVTSRGVVISGGSTAGIEHWSLSGRDPALTWQEAILLAAQLKELRHVAGPSPEVVPGTAGVFHVLVRSL
jgi:Prolipoprotein diacylglyceryl transferase